MKRIIIVLSLILFSTAAFGQWWKTYENFYKHSIRVEDSLLMKSFERTESYDPEERYRIVSILWLFNNTVAWERKDFYDTTFMWKLYSEYGRRRLSKKQSKRSGRDEYIFTNRDAYILDSNDVVRGEYTSFLSRRAYVATRYIEDKEDIKFIGKIMREEKPQFMFRIDFSSPILYYDQHGTLKAFDDNKQKVYSYGEFVETYIEKLVNDPYNKGNRGNYYRDQLLSAWGNVDE